MKRFLALCLALSLVLTLAPALGEEEKVLNIFSWEGYVDETTIANFTAETGSSINYAVFASNEEMLMKLQANGASEYDIIIASDYILSLARKENLLLPLDKEQLTGWEDVYKRQVPFRLPPLCLTSGKKYDSIRDTMVSTILEYHRNENCQ